MHRLMRRALPWAYLVAAVAGLFLFLLEALRG